MKKILIAVLALMSLSACSGQVSTNVSSLYSGHETGSWYQLGASCVAGVCPVN